ncbi:LuxR C-terminal-related transcriptional regulator [Aetokthonos hydrillicola Thurmond2011]|jgi:DNA-binding CsgD family transcriptional regulator|uniref:LuxR C-terminal-related transcriptional regulator n=1 Tax=Aetokthonos hydrillicola Thurmond2011 TaxID=2712845 RepID=A0AAP5IDS4_9CYAN|nr:LuxR C-terminal-related transcriptional regulator [Aetokthonos hydrillicola]MBO3460082.1 response regulator transcription factor [Aetokthonos hydrillicola CCALA 1050]MBW4589519.1 hypothetical protein [Aetokthonos hydrillicola CCALA 1050]MDR9899815.1 LuxR C-terminal-related transcriptional regulator [Aetokthonos hydrillicola Thurmond2011]
MQTNIRSVSSDTKQLNQTSDFSPVSEFFINNSHFLIISVSESTDKNNQFVSATSNPDKSLSIIGYFEFNGNPYAVAVIQTPNPSEVIDSTLTSRLTGRELQIAALVALGWSNKQVAKQLHISEWTVSAHLRRIFIKLDVDSRAAMVYQCASLINRLHQLGVSPTSLMQVNS